MVLFMKLKMGLIPGFFYGENNVLNQIQQLLDANTRVPPAAIKRQGEMVRLASNKSEIYFPKHDSTVYDSRKGFDNYSPYPQFVLTPPANAKQLDQNNYLIDSASSSIDFQLRIRSGSRILTKAEKTADQKWDNVYLSINGQKQDTILSSGDSNPFEYGPFSFNSQTGWQPVGNNSGLSSISLYAAATNTSWVSGTHTYLSKQDGFRQEMNFSDNATFIFYRYTGYYPASVRAVIIASGSGEILAYYYFYKNNGGKWISSFVNVADGKKIKSLADGDGNITLQLYAGFKSRSPAGMKDGSLTFCKSDLNLNLTEAEEWLAKLTGWNVNPSDNFLVNLAPSSFPDISQTGLILGNIMPADVYNSIKSENMMWMDAKNIEMSADILLNKTGIFLSGHDMANNEVDSDPQTEVGIDTGSASQSSFAFINYEHSTPMYLPLCFDNEMPVLTYFNTVSDKRGNLGEWDFRKINNACNGIARLFSDIGKENITIKLKADDDKTLDKGNTFAFLIPDNPDNNKVNDFYLKRDAYLSDYASSIDDKGRKDAFQSFLGNVRNIGGIEIVSSGNGIKWGNPLTKGEIRNNTAEYGWNSGSINLQANNNIIPNGRYKLALLMADSVTFHRLSYLASSGGITKFKNDMVLLADNVNPPEDDLNQDGCFLSPDFAIDYTPPTFTFSLGDLFSDIMQGLGNALVLTLSDNLSRNIHVSVTSKDKSTGEELNKWEFVVHNADRILTGNFGDVTVETISGIPVSFDTNTGKFTILWDLKEFLEGKGKLAQGLSGVFTVEAADDAGNSWVDGIDFNVDKIVEETAKKALYDVLGVSDKCLIVAPGISAGGVEIDPVKYVLVGKGVNAKSISITPEDERDSGKAAVDKIRKAVIDYYNSAGGGKIVLSTWGKAGIWVRKMLLDEKDLPAGQRMAAPRISKIIEIGVPANGYNSISMAAQSYAAYLTIAPVLGLLSSVNIDLNPIGIDTNIKPNDIIRTLTGMDIEDTVKKIVRNDDIINPFNYISILLGRADSALSVDANSSLMNSIRNFNPEDIGVEVSSTSSAFWPDMPFLFQAGVVVFAGAGGFAGLYTGTKLFSTDSKVFNNLDEELGKIASEYAEEALNNMVYTPLWLKIENQLKTVSDSCFEIADDDIGTIVTKKTGSGITVIESKLNEVKNALMVIRRFTSSTPQQVRSQAYKRLKDLILTTPGLSGGYSTFADVYGGQFQVMGDKISEIGSQIKSISPTVRSLISDGREWLNGSKIKSAVENSLSGGNTPDWIRQIFPNFSSMAGQMVQDAYSEIIQTAFYQLGNEYGVNNLYNELQSYMDQAGQIADQVDSTVDGIKNTSSCISVIFDNNEIRGFFSDLTNETELSNSGHLDAFSYFIDSYLAFLQGDVSSILDEVSGMEKLYNNLNYSGSSLVSMLENIKQRPILFVQGLYDRGVSYLNAATKQIIQDKVSTLVDCILPVPNISVSVPIPPGFAGAAIMGTAALLATDYLKNTDLKSEGGELIMTKIFGLQGGQSGGGGITGSFDKIVTNENLTLSKLGGEAPPVLLLKINGNPVSQYKFTEGKLGIQTLLNSRSGQVTSVENVMLNEFVNSIEGIVRANIPQLGKLMYSINYSDYKEVPLSAKGEFKLSGLHLLEGRNVIAFTTCLAYKNRSGNEVIAGEIGSYAFEIFLDMMPMQAYPIYPKIFDVVNLNRTQNPEIAVGVYNSDMGAELKRDNLKIYLKRLSIPWMQETVSGYYDDWTPVTDYTISQNDATSWNVSFPLQKKENIIPEGEYAVMIETIDMMGNQSTTVTGFYNDTTPPIADIENIGIVNHNQTLMVAYKLKDTPIPMLRQYGNENRRKRCPCQNPLFYRP